MYKPLLVLAALGLCQPALAQTERGNKLLGVSLGDLSYAHRGQKNSYVSAAMHPTAGYFVADNLLLGATLNLGYERQKSGDAIFARQFSYGLSPLVRYYALGQGRHQVFGEVGADLGWVSYRGTLYDYRPVDEPYLITSRRTESRGYHAALGYGYFLTSSAALEVMAGYRRLTHSEITDERDGLDIRIGFTAFLPSAAKK